MSRRPRGAALAALLLLSVVSCGRDSDAYRSFVASHDAIRPGMSIQQVFESGLADYLIGSDGKTLAGATPPEKSPASRECARHVVDIHAGGGAFTLRVYCNMNGPSDRQLAAPGSFASKREFLDGLPRYAPWLSALRFRVESPALQVGGVYDSYEFAIDETGRVIFLSPIRQA